MVHASQSVVCQRTALLGDTEGYKKRKEFVLASRF